MNVLELIVARHGQSQANHLNIIQGQTSTPLSELGQRQAVALGKALAGMTFDAVYASDLERAMQTARLAAPGFEPVPCEALREWNLGVFQGLTYSEAAEGYPAEWKAFCNSQTDFRIPGGESSREIFQRVRLFLDGILDRHRNGRILLVSHGGIIRCILKLALALDDVWPTPPCITNASYSKFTIRDGRWRLDCWNCTQHLDGLLDKTGVF